MKRKKLSRELWMRLNYSKLTKNGRNLRYCDQSRLRLTEHIANAFVSSMPEDHRPGCTFNDGERPAERTSNIGFHESRGRLSLGDFALQQSR
jgi:hypothetical protein